MTARWLVVALWFSCVISALMVVHVTHQVRKETDQLEGLRRESAHLQVEWGQFLLEQSTWASYSRVRTEAERELQMQVPESGQIIFVGKE
ncbi:cell division protein FtsL [Gilvimarinus agarilyticus]|uniref:cell division protein FtsL n=1 Tax=unclassified Gilvimarinus TaxID=2642066 RepID=UPI001C0840A0|nr:MULTISPECIES: cell division protein FtsL [unclassified Gilvimarinus]MBU2885395.1 cell division protein FtsL [Gilvimarinus agarilyticus]MDO6570294.1 cell division protein FtsL [Gilvimarinus sp. 2_MG-2023]MDO6746918.1 cell division protein FtsL [Gilvimarinus sp. 1_MG-2023]